jgi:hypothetical protein
MEQNPCRFEIGGFPPGGGVYVIRFDGKTISRLRGETQVLKIGWAKNYRTRFRGYGHTDVLADENLAEQDVSLKEIIGGNRDQMASRVVVYALTRLLRPPDNPSIVVDFYPNASEREFLLEFVDRHLEPPPLNFSLSSKRTAR